jgi:hypothetical protein
MNTNVRSTFLFTRHAVPVMLKQGEGLVLMISSMAGLYGFAGEAVYCATKFAQVGFAHLVFPIRHRHIHPQFTGSSYRSFNSRAAATSRGSFFPLGYFYRFCAMPLNVVLH